jgi:hypothetical protein
MSAAGPLAALRPARKAASGVFFIPSLRLGENAGVVLLQVTDLGDFQV